MGAGCEAIGAGGAGVGMAGGMTGGVIIAPVAALPAIESIMLARAWTRSSSVPASRAAYGGSTGLLMAGGAANGVRAGSYLEGEITRHINITAFLQIELVDLIPCNVN